MKAEIRLAEMNGFAVHDHLMAKLSLFLERDLSRIDLDAPLPNETDSTKGHQASQSRVTALTGIARREVLTLRQLLLRLAGGRGHLMAVGTGKHIASVTQEWFENSAADGFNVMPGDLQSFNDIICWSLKETDYGATSTETLRKRYHLSNC